MFKMSVLREDEAHLVVFTIIHSILIPNGTAWLGQHFYPRGVRQFCTVRKRKEGVRIQYGAVEIESFGFCFGDRLLKGVYS